MFFWKQNFSFGFFLPLYTLKSFKTLILLWVNCTVWLFNSLWLWLLPCEVCWPDLTRITWKHARFEVHITSENAAVARVCMGISMPPGGCYYPKKNRQNKAYLFRSKKPINCRPRGILHMAHAIDFYPMPFTNYVNKGRGKSQKCYPKKEQAKQGVPFYGYQDHRLPTTWHMTRGSSFRIKVPHFDKRPFTNYVNSLRGNGSLKNVHITL